MVAAHLNDVTLCLAYYQNSEMLKHQYQCLAVLPVDLRRHISLIVVDDGSPSEPAEGALLRMTATNETPAQRDGESTSAYHARRRIGIADFKMFRMDVDVRWNQDACRNLAVSQAETKWLLLTDVDHIVLEETWRRIILGRLSWKSVYTF